MTVVEGGGGSNRSMSTASSDPLVLYGAESGSGVEYNSTRRRRSRATPMSFTNFGYDTIDASGATGTVRHRRRPDGDTLTGGSGINWIAGGEGDDTSTRRGRPELHLRRLELHGRRTRSPRRSALLPIDLASRLLTIDNGTVADGRAATAVGRRRSRSPSPAAAPAPCSAPMASSTSRASRPAWSIRSRAWASGSDHGDRLGQHGAWRLAATTHHRRQQRRGDRRGRRQQIIVGSVGADVIIGANGEVDYVNGILSSVESIDPTHGGNDTISGSERNGRRVWKQRRHRRRRFRHDHPRRRRQHRHRQ